MGRLKALINRFYEMDQAHNLVQNALLFSFLGFSSGCLLINADISCIYSVYGIVLCWFCLAVLAGSLSCKVIFHRKVVVFFKAVENRISTDVNTYRKNRVYDKNKKERRAVIAARSKAKDKIRVGFYSDIPSLMSTFDTVYASMAGDSNFEPIYLAYPQVDYDQISNYRILDYFAEKNYPYTKMYHEDTCEYVDIASLELDYLFVNRHYAVRRPSAVNFEELMKKTVLCMIPYVISPAGGTTQDTVCRFSEMLEFDYQFAENKEMEAVYRQYQKQAGISRVKIEAVGSPKYDSIYYVDNTCPDSKFCQTVLYTPRWNIFEGTCSFFELKNYFFELVEQNPDIKYIFRPHPLMEVEIGNKVMGCVKWKEFVESFQYYDNAEIDLNGDYRPSFKEATVLVTDISSMMMEFLITGKPVIYFCMKDMLSPFNQKLASGYYFCKSKESVDRALSELRIGKDPLAEERQRLVSEVFQLGGATAADNIKKCILEDYRQYTC